MNSGLTVKFHLRRLWHRTLGLLYPEARAVCALCQRPMGPLQVKTLAQERRMTQTTLVTQETGENQQEIQAHTKLDGVCFFCLQDVAISSFQQWTGILSMIPAMMAPETAVEIPLFCAVTYEGIVRDTIRHWKYDGRIEFTRYLATLLVSSLTSDEVYQTARWDVFVPVPTSVDRWKKRGYHHVGLLANELQKLTGIPYEELLTRQPTDAFTQSQTAKSAEERRTSLKGQYQIQTGADVFGKNLILVDDVITTGATMAACAQALLDAGATTVLGAAVAHVD